MRNDDFFFILIPLFSSLQKAYSGYTGAGPPYLALTLPTLWYFIRMRFPAEIHVRIKRYSMEEVLQDSTWLDKQWSEKDRMLGHFSRHQSFPTDSRGFCQHRVFDTRRHAVESSILALLRLLFLPCTLPFLLLLSVPMFWAGVWMWLAFKLFKLVFPDWDGGSSRMAAGGTASHDETGATQTPGSAEGGVASSVGTPYFPATPFVSPSVASWRNVHADSHRGDD